MKIFVSGSLAYDRIMNFPGKFSDHILPDKIHILNVCFMVDGLAEKFGGTAGNIAYNLSLLDEKPMILATAGKDFSNYESWLLRNNLPLSGIRKIPEEFTAGAYITTDIADNQITGFNPGAMDHPSLYQFDKINKEPSLAIIAPGNLEDMLTLSRAYKESRTPYIFDPGQSIPALSQDHLIEMITGSELLISNDYELEMIIKSTELQRSDLLARTKAVITTVGENGSIIYNSNQETKISAATAFQVNDPTGAGDAYRAGLIKGLIMGKSLPEAACMGSTCASFAIELHGTQEHRFTQDEFWTRHQINFG